MRAVLCAWRPPSRSPLRPIGAPGRSCPWLKFGRPTGSASPRRSTRSRSHHDRPRRCCHIAQDRVQRTNLHTDQSCCLVGGSSRPQYLKQPQGRAGSHCVGTTRSARRTNSSNLRFTTNRPSPGSSRGSLVRCFLLVRPLVLIHQCAESPVSEERREGNGSPPAPRAAQRAGSRAVSRRLTRRSRRRRTPSARRAARTIRLPKATGSRSMRSRRAPSCGRTNMSGAQHRVMGGAGPPPAVTEWHRGRRTHLPMQRVRCMPRGSDQLRC